MRSATRELALRRQRKHAAHLHAFARRLIDLGMGVAENRRTIAHAVIDILVVVEIDDPRAHAALHVDGALLAPEAKIRSHAERQAFDGALKMRVALGQVSGHDVPLEIDQADLDISRDRNIRREPRPEHIICSYKSLAEPHPSAAPGGMSGVSCVICGKPGYFRP